MKEISKHLYSDAENYLQKLQAIHGKHGARTEELSECEKLAADQIIPLVKT